SGRAGRTGVPATGLPATGVPCVVRSGRLGRRGIRFPAPDLAGLPTSRRGRLPALVRPGGATAHRVRPAARRARRVLPTSRIARWLRPARAFHAVPAARFPTGDLPPDRRAGGDRVG